jgi:hypothetical protein
MVNKGNILSIAGVLSARVPALLYAGTGNDGRVESWRTQPRIQSANLRRRRIKGWRVRPDNSPDYFTRALPSEAQPHAEIETWPSLTRRRPALVSHLATSRRTHASQAGFVRQQSCRRAGRPSASGTTRLRLCSLSYSSLTLCCVAPCLGWQRGHAAPCNTVRETDAMVIAERGTPLYIANTCVLRGCEEWLPRGERAQCRRALLVTSRIGSMLS